MWVRALFESACSLHPSEAGKTSESDGNGRRSGELTVDPMVPVEPADHLWSECSSGATVSAFSPP